MNQNGVVQHTEAVTQSGAKAATLRIAIGKAVSDENYCVDQRRRLMILYMSLALEHHDAVMCLLRTGTLVGSAMALIRPLLETSVRGLWLGYVATEEQVHQIAANTLGFSKFEKLIAGLNEAHGDRDVFSHLGGKNWGILCGLNHSGIEQLGRRQLPDGSVEIRYDEGEIIEVMNYATASLFMYALGFCSVMGRRSQRDEIVQLYRRFFGGASDGILRELPPRS